MTRPRRLAAGALSGAAALSCAVLTAPAHAAPSVDTPVATVQLGSTAAAVRPAWDARTDSGAFVPSGTYAWKLTAEPRDGPGPAHALTGTTTAG